jgi:hypothetical protein
MNGEKRREQLQNEIRICHPNYISIEDPRCNLTTAACLPLLRGPGQGVRALRQREQLPVES